MQIGGVDMLGDLLALGRDSTFVVDTVEKGVPRNLSTQIESQ